MAGPVSQVEGRYAILPVTITHNNQPLRATNPQPCSGTRSRAHAIASLQQLARTLTVEHAYPAQKLKFALPIAEWDATPTLRHRAQNITCALNTMACVRIAGKSGTMMFAFCRQWVWDHTDAFLHKEKYIAHDVDHKSRIQAALYTIMCRNNWPINSSRGLPL